MNAKTIQEIEKVEKCLRELKGLINGADSSNRKKLKKIDYALSILKRSKEILKDF